MRGAHRPHDGFGHDLGRERAHLSEAEAGLERPRGQGEHGVAVTRRVRRHDGARQPVLRHLRHLVDLGLCQPRVGRDDADRRVLARTARRVLASYDAARVGKTAVVGAGSRHDAPGSRVDHVAHRVDDDDGADGEAALQGDRRRADPALHGHAHPAHLPHRGAGARAHAPFRNGLGGGAGRGLVSAIGAGTDAAGKAQVEDDRGRHDGDDQVAADAVALAALFQVAHDTVPRGEAEGAPARQHDRVDLLDGVHRIEEIGLGGPGSAAAHVNAPRRASVRDHDGATRVGIRVGEVADPDAGDRGDSTRGRRVFQHRHVFLCHRSRNPEGGHRQGGQCDPRCWGHRFLHRLGPVMHATKITAGRACPWRTGSLSGGPAKMAEATLARFLLSNGARSGVRFRGGRKR